MIVDLPRRSETPEGKVQRLFRNKRILDDVQVTQARISLNRERVRRPDIWSDPEPLITVRICTYNRPQLLVERAVASVLRQTYQNFEVLVIGDHASPETAQALSRVTDPRVRYVNLPERARYPNFPRFFWQTAGAYPALAAHELATGEWMAFLDDDDEYTSDHLEALLAHARLWRLEMVYAKVKLIDPPADYDFVGSEPLTVGCIASGSVMFSRRLFCVRPDPHGWVNDLPGDWLLWSKMQKIGARIGFLDRFVTLHYPEHTMVDDEDQADILDRTPTSDEIISDLEHVGGLHMLDLA